jgi:hypothetical protein
VLPVQPPFEVERFLGTVRAQTNGQMGLAKL